MKRIIRLTENDLTRIVRRVIKEQETVGGGGSAVATVGSKLSNGMEIINLKKSQDGVFVQTETAGGGQQFSCKSHEAGKYTLRPKGTITKEESQVLYDKYCKK
jgi:hypothetical protein